MDMSINRAKNSNRKMFDTKIKRIYERPLDYTPQKYLDKDNKLPEIGYDPQMRVDVYGHGTLLTELQTIATTILRLMYIVPGQFPDYPELGIDIRRYLFTFDDQFTAAALRQEILRQVPALNTYVSDPSMFLVEKKSLDGSPWINIRLASSFRDTNGFEWETSVNIGISFDKMNQLISDMTYSQDGENFKRFIITNPHGLK